jgi:hypothetical protein
MNSDNENNGWPASDSYDLNEDLFRGEWGFGGAVMTDWGGGQSTPLVSMHAGCDMIMPGRTAGTLAQFVGVKEPTFNEDGSIADQGDFVFDEAQDEPPTYSIETNLTSVDDAPESVKEAVKAGYASIFTRGGKVVVGWYGSVQPINKICIGDLQKSARHILGNALVSQDMVKLYKDLLDTEIEGTLISEAREGKILTGEFAHCEKSDLIEYSGLIVADNTFVDVTLGEEETHVNVYAETFGDVKLTSVRMYVSCDLPITRIESDYDFEYNPDNNMIVVYSDDGEAFDGARLFSVYFDLTGEPELGYHDVDIALIQATDDTPTYVNLYTDNGYVLLFDGSVPETLHGDVDRDGDVDNADVIMIARYLVELETFDDEQMVIADFNEDDTIDNLDLILIVKYVISH